MALPTLKVRFSPTTNPADSPVWVDITTDVRAFDTDRGRDSELERIGTGTATVALNNRGGDYDPNNSSSPYAGDLLPMRRIEILATSGGTDYPVWSGFVEEWPQSYPGVRDAVVQVPCVDGFEFLANSGDLDATYSQEDSGTRVGNVLDDVGWPAGLRDLDTGQSEVEAATLSAANALTHIQQVALAEDGVFFMSRDGRATFYHRYQPILNDLDAANYTFGRNGHAYQKIGEIPATLRDVRNRIVASRDAGSEVVVTDATSQDRYLVRPDRVGVGILLTSDNEVESWANARLTRLREPNQEIRRLGIHLGRLDLDAVRVLDRDLRDKIRAEKHPPHGGGTITQDSFIEGIEHRWRPGSWWVFWRLGDIVRRADYWVLGTSRLGADTRLGF